MRTMTTTWLAGDNKAQFASATTPLGGMITKELGTTPQGALGLAGALQLREIAGCGVQGHSLPFGSRAVLRPPAMVGSGMQRREPRLKGFAPRLRYRAREQRVRSGRSQ
jgi:hypothetical protein